MYFFKPSIKTFINILKYYYSNSKKNPIQELESEIANLHNLKYAAIVGSGTDSLKLILDALEIKNDDEIIIPAYGCVALAESIIHQNAIPVFVDIDNNSFNSSINEIYNKISSKTKAVIFPYQFNEIADLNILKKHLTHQKIYLIEDAAQAFCTNSNIGQFGDVTCFSFHPGKLPSGFDECGAVACNNIQLINKIKLLRNHGYNNTSLPLSVGYNSQTSATNAISILEVIGKLNNIREFNLKILSIIINKIKDMKYIEIYSTNNLNIKNIYHQPFIIFKSLESLNLVSFLQKNNIPVYFPYPKIIPEIVIYKKYSLKNNAFIESKNRVKEIFIISTNYFKKNSNTSKFIYLLNNYKKTIY